MKQLITGAIVAGLIFIQVPSAVAGVPLGSAQLKNLAPGRYKVTLMGVSNMTVALSGNGTILGAANGAKDKGHWNLNGNQICIGWNNWLGGSTRCSGLMREAGYYQGSGFTITPI